MAKVDVQLRKTLYNSAELSKAVNTEFKTFTTPSEVQPEDTVEEFFRLYDAVYLEIPIEGEANSHTYLVNKSNELVNIDTINAEIQPLLDEINQLRSELLTAQEEINTLNLKLANGGN